MKRLFFIGLIFLSISWVYLLPVIINPDINTALIMISIGVFFLILGFWKTEFRPINKKYIILLIPLLISILFIPFPFNIGIIILNFGIIGYFITTYLLKKENSVIIWKGVFLSGLVLTVQATFFPLFVILFSRIHRIDFLAYPIYYLTKIFGVNATLSQGIIYTNASGKIFANLVTFEKLGGYLWFFIMIGFLVYLIFISEKKNILINLVKFFIISFVYLIIRYIVVMQIYIILNEEEVFWNPYFTLITFIPFAFVLIKFVSLKDFKIDLKPLKTFELNRKRLVSMALLFILVFSLAGAFIFQDPGMKKQGRVLIDEYHSDWEDTTIPMDTEWYGMISTYNYYNWAEWLNKYYSVDRNINDSLTSNLLDNYDILILKCPTNPYSKQEINDILKFVENGGGLYLIGDHTNVFGMNYYLNQISEEVGISFKSDSTYLIQDGGFSVYEPFEMTSHPVIKNTEGFQYLTSCTIQAPLEAEEVMAGYGLMVAQGSYATKDFFPEHEDTAVDKEFGIFLQSAALKYGKGRIVAFSDSTCFSNFCIFMDGYSSYNLGVMDYLNRSNSYSYLNILFIGIAIICFGFVIYTLRKEGKAIAIFLALLVAIPAFFIATPVYSSINDRNYTQPTPHSDYTQLCFVEEYSDLCITSVPPPPEKGHKTFNTFFVWSQRVGCYPSVEKTLEDAVDKGDAIVIINPDKTFSQDDINLITNYVRSGGNLLLMDSIINYDSTANKMLAPFSITVNPRNMNYKNVTIENNTIGNIISPKTSLYIKGDKNTLFTEDEESCIGYAKFGLGNVVVVVDSYTFSNRVMYGDFVVPDDALKEIYNLEFYILEDLLLNKSLVVEDINAVDNTTYDKSSILQLSIDNAINFLNNSQTDYGEFVTYGCTNKEMDECYIDSTPSTTAYVIYSIKDVNHSSVSTMIDNGLDFLQSEEEEGGIWQYFASRNPRHDSLEPDFDDTAFISAILTMFNRSYEDNINLFENYRNNSGVIYTWMKNLSDNEIDSEVNSNILFYFAEKEIQDENICDFINRQIISENYSSCIYCKDENNSKNPMFLFYVASRAYKHGNNCLNESKEKIIDEILSRQKYDGSFGTSLDTAFALNALMNYGYYKLEIVEFGIQSLLQNQAEDGSWERDIAWLGPAYYGSEELTTAIAIEAINQYLLHIS